MKTRLFAVVAFLFVLQWSTRAMADFTITGTVGEIAVGIAPNNNNVIEFKLTDLNQTKTCVTNPGYAWFNSNSNPSWYKEWYAMLLVSKKGAPIKCILGDNIDCQLKQCILP